jgi:uroporphyrinogen III methyltransferase/synthase
MTGTGTSLRTENDPGPLAGRRIVITRARKQAERLAQLIESLGGIVIEFPTIEICPPQDYAGLDAAIENIAHYDWLILTSVNSVEPFLSRMAARQTTVAALTPLRVGAIGPETAKALQAAGVQCDLVPARFQAEGILDALSPRDMHDKRVLIPRAEKAREILPETLRAWGASVDVVVAYRTVLPRTDTAPLLRSIEQGAIDMITFTSSSTVSNFVRLFAQSRLSEILGSMPVACIGPITERTVVELGGRVAVVATEFTIPGLVQAIVNYFTGQKGA